jgi:hypothetical protein
MVINAGMEIDFKDEHFENAESPSVDNLEPESNMISQSEEQSQKHESPTVVQFAGIEIDFNDIHFENEDSPRTVNLETLSNLISQRCNSLKVE